MDTANGYGHDGREPPASRARRTRSTRSNTKKSFMSLFERLQPLPIFNPDLVNRRSIVAPRAKMERAIVEPSMRTGFDEAPMLVKLIPFRP
jgi:hypothetical protein